MGTNYYLHQNVCPHCGRSDEPIHIGKSSFGWTFSFRGYRKEWQYESLGKPIVSEDDWRSFIDAQVAAGAVLKDEYGDGISVAGFWSMVDSKRGSPNSHRTACLKDHYEHAMRDCWDDDKGNTFQEGDFS